MDNFTVIDIETTGDSPWKDELLAVGIGKEVLMPDLGMQRVREVLTDPASLVVAHTNYDLRWLILAGAPFVDGVRYHDTKVMAFMLDHDQELGLDPLCQRYLGKKLLKPIRQVKGQIMMECSLGLVPIKEVPWAEMKEYNQQDIDVTAELYLELKARLQASGQWDMFLEEEAPFSTILVEMEVAGMPMDWEGLQKLLEGAREERDELGASLMAETGVIGFNLNSGDAVANFLYDELPTFKVQMEVPELAHLKPGGKNGKCRLCGGRLSPATKPGAPREHIDTDLEPCLGRTNLREDAIRKMLPSNLKVDRIGNKYVYGHQTVDGRGLAPPKIRRAKGKMPKRPKIDAETLSLRYGHDPWVANYLRWKSLQTLCRNYLEQWVDAYHDGRIHGRFDQARTETGRVASRDPNLQAIPVTMEWNVRTLFAAPLMIGDYSGLDARVAAHFCEDPLMLDIFRNNRDLYGTLAANAWGGPADKSNENRNLMKILFLSAQYGAAAGSIGDKIRISGLGDEFAKKSPKLLQDLEETLPTLFAWREEVLKEAQARGYITTLSGRRRYLPDLYSDEWYPRSRAERQCVASMVQGTSADIVRRCMIEARRQIPLSAAKMILQVHDEILWELGPDWEDGMFDQLVHICETAHNFDLNVPMKFDASLGTSWDEKDAQGARSYRIAMTGGAKS